MRRPVLITWLAAAVVVREGQENEKKGWFRRKKKSSTSSQSVSRPPSAANFGIAKKRTSESSATDDDGLPPREDPTTPTAPASQPQQPPKSPAAVQDGDLGASEIPVHAGFDFAAIKDVIGQSGQSAEEVQVPQPSRYPPPSLPVHPPTLRTESAPPPLPETPSPSRTPKPRPSLNLPPVPREDEPVAGPSNSPRADLSSTLSRSLSLNNMSEAAAEADMTSSFGASSSASRQPALSFGGSDGSIWPSQEPDPTPTFGGRFGGGYQLPSNSSALRSSDVLSNPFASGSGGLRSDRLPSPSENPFASAAAPSLSFGGADGSITFPGGSASTGQAGRSPWDIGNPYGSGKKASSSTLDLNPWQS